MTPADSLVRCLIGSVSVAGWPYAALGGRIGLSVADAQAARFDDFGGGTIVAETTQPVDVPTTRPTVGWVSSAFPNPTRGGARFSLVLPKADEVHWSVLDILGREVWSSSPRHYEPGSWSLSWQESNVPVGLYLARIHVGSEIFLRRIAVLR